MKSGHENCIYTKTNVFKGFTSDWQKEHTAFTEYKKKSSLFMKMFNYAAIVIVCLFISINLLIETRLEVSAEEIHQVDAKQTFNITFDPAGGWWQDTHIGNTRTWFFSIESADLIPPPNVGRHGFRFYGWTNSDIIDENHKRTAIWQEIP